MSEREWRFYLDDMIGFAEKVLAYTEGFDQTAFVASGLNYDATVRNLELIGEAA
ncbi:MAG: HepT-like ribonuclease domain-containing protein, partial [Burkholderiales bacterium]